MEQTGEKRFVILSPETPSSNSAILADRIQEALTDELDLPILWGIAEVPREAVTFGELIRMAAGRLVRHPGRHESSASEPEQVDHATKEQDF